MTYKLSGGSAQPRIQPARSPPGCAGLLFESFWDLLSAKMVNKTGPETPDSQNQLFRPLFYQFSIGCSYKFGARPSAVLV